MASRLYRTTGTRNVSEWVPDPPPVLTGPPAQPNTPKPSVYRPPVKAPDPAPEPEQVVFNSPFPDLNTVYQYLIATGETQQDAYLSVTDKLRPPF